jgi:RND superfamily putative drug exporter
MRTVAKWCYVHRRITLGAWVAALLALTAIHSAVGSSYSNSFSLPGTQSYQALKLLERNAPKASGDTEQVVIAVRHGSVRDPGVRARVTRMLASLSTLPHVTSVASPYGPHGSAQISPSGRVAFANVTFDVQDNQVSNQAAQTFVNTARAGSGHSVEVDVDGQVAETVAQSGPSGVLFGFLAAGIVLFGVFGSLLAVLLPLVSAGLSLGTAVAVIGLATHVIGIPTFGDQLSLLIGLGVGVDYALFIVTRHRQGLLRGLSGEQAVVEAVDTSGRAVVFAGVIVCIAMLGLAVLGFGLVTGAGIAASVAVAFTVLAALTAMPALLGFFGLRVLRRRERRALGRGRLRVSDESPGWSRWAARLRRRPALAALVAGGLLVLIALPAHSMRLGSVDSGTDPSASTTRKAYDLVAQGFGRGYSGPLQLVAQVSGRAQRAQFMRVERAVASTAGVAGSAPPRFIPGRAGVPGVALADVYPTGSPQDASTARLLHTVREKVVPAAERGTDLRVLVGGQTAAYDDFSTVLAGKLPLFFGLVVALSFLLLMAVFRSLVIPLVAGAMNLLSAAAAFGVITAVFQDGVGASLLGIDKTGPIDAFVPVLMFAVLFGLSMDYEVFLVSRIYEEWRRRGNNAEAITHGLAATGRTITAAAMIMVLVFGAFVLGGQFVIDLFGIGLSSAVLLDAVIVRSVLVPALMLMIGDANWKLPRLLARRLPHLRVEGRAVARAAATPSELSA